MTAMTFLELQNAVIDKAFDESDRAAVKTWLNFRLAWIFDLEDWTFTQDSDLVTVTAGSQSVSSLPADFAIALGLDNELGDPLEPIDEYRNFARRYIGSNNSAAGRPEAFHADGTSILVGPTPSITSAAYLLSYEKEPTLLVADADEPGIPEGYHLALVHGAKAEGFKLSNVPLAEQFDDDFQAAITAMRRKYLRPMRGTSAQVPAWRPC